MKKEIIVLTGSNLDFVKFKKIIDAPNEQITINIDPQSAQKMKASRDYVHKIVKQGKPVYGINTGFGALANKHISTDKLSQLQLNLIRSHCTGVGEYFNRQLTRAIILLRTNCLISGYSGVNPIIVDLLCDFLHFGIHPLIPQQGSVGASGDLAPLAHLALSLIGEGEVEYQNKIMKSSVAFAKIKRQPIELGPKDGLALINGTAVMTALGMSALIEAKNLIKMADIAGALTVEAVRGTDVAFLPEITRLKPHAGQWATSTNLIKLLENSPIRDSHHDCQKVQDPYSLRCMPQVHGAIRQTIKHAEEVLGVELNAVTDNPLIFPEEDKVISGGNFHGEALALCMDYLCMGLAELCNISERRVEKLINPTFSDLPAFLTRDSGLHSGLMIAHVTMAALVSENKYLCHPASVDSIPTSTDKEDHVSMGVTAGLKLHKVLKNLKICLSIELLCNTQGLEFLKPLKTSPPLQAAYDLIRQFVPPIEEDRVFAYDIKAINHLIENQSVLQAVEQIMGELQ